MQCDLQVAYLWSHGAAVAWHDGQSQNAHTSLMHLMQLRALLAASRRNRWGAANASILSGTCTGWNRWGELVQPRRGANVDRVTVVTVMSDACLHKPGPRDESSDANTSDA